MVHYQEVCFQWNDLKERFLWSSVIVILGKIIVIKDTINPLKLFIFTKVIHCSRLPLWVGYFIYFKFTRVSSMSRNMGRKTPISFNLRKYVEKNCKLNSLLSELFSYKVPKTSYNQTLFSYRSYFSIFVLRWSVFKLIKNPLLKLRYNSC